jgi:hypothetical protein
MALVCTGMIEYSSGNIGHFIKQGSSLGKVYSFEKIVRFFVSITDNSKWKVGDSIIVVNDNNSVCIETKVGFISG